MLYGKIASNYRGMKVRECCYFGASIFSPPLIGPFSFHYLLLAFNHFKLVLLKLWPRGKNSW